MGHDQVSGEVNVLCWLAVPVAMFYGTVTTHFEKITHFEHLQNLVIRSKSVIKSSSVISSQIGVIGGVIVYGHVPEFIMSYISINIYYSYSFYLLLSILSAS